MVDLPNVVLKDLCKIVIDILVHALEAQKREHGLPYVLPILQGGTIILELFLLVSDMENDCVLDVHVFACERTK